MYREPLFRMHVLKNSVCLILILFVFGGSSVQAALQPPGFPFDVNADAWLIMNREKGEILSEKNMGDRHFPASITKIVTAIIAIEQKDLDEVVTISRTAADTIGSSLYLEEGDEITLRDLLYGSMLHSGNDGAVAIAEHISDSESEFAKRMTAFVQSIGALATHFTNASGLPDDEHYTTAKDMAIITAYAMDNSSFREMVQHKTYNWNETLWRDNLLNHEKEEAKGLGVSWTGSPQIINHNRLLNEYDGAIGIKNGFTHEARYTVVGAAKRDKTELIAVVLKSYNADTAYQDITKILDYGFTLSRSNDDENKQMDNEFMNNPASFSDRQTDKDVQEQMEENEVVSIDSGNNDPSIAKENSSLLESIPVIVYVASLVIGWVVIILILKIQYNRKEL